MATKPRFGQLNYSLFRLTCSADISWSANNTGTIALNSAAIDPNGEINTATNRWVASRSGYGLFTAKIQYSTNPTSGMYYQIKLFKNGAETDHVFMPANSGYTYSEQGTWLVSFNAGDYFQLGAYNGEANTAQATQTFLQGLIFYT